MHRPAQFIGPAGCWLLAITSWEGGYSSVVWVFTWGYDMMIGRGGFVSFFGPGPGCCWKNLMFALQGKRKEREGKRGGNMDTVSDSYKKYGTRPASLVYV